MVELLKLNGKQVCELLSISRMTLNRWVKDGCPRNPDGSYPGPAVVGWVVARVEEKAEADNQNPVVGAVWLEEFRKERALIARLDRLHREGELILVADEAEGNAKRLINLVHGLNSFCDRLPPLLVGRDREAISAVIEDEIELLMHAYRRHGRYDEALADQILSELGGRTNRQKRVEHARLHYAQAPRKEQGNETKAESPISRS